MNFKQLSKQNTDPFLAEEIARAKALLNTEEPKNPTQTVIDFFSMVIHEVKNPIAAIKTLMQSFTEELEENLVNQPEVLSSLMEYQSRIFLK